MSQWTDRIRNHAIWKQLEALGPVLDRASVCHDNSPLAIIGIERLKAVLAYSGKRLAAVDPDLVQPTALDSLNSALSSVSAEVQQFISNATDEHLVTANSYADTALSALSSLPFHCPPDDLTVISESAASYRNALEGFLNKAADSSRNALGAITSLTAKLDELGATQEVISGKVAAVTEHLAQLSTAIEEQRKLNSTTLAEQQAAFTTAQTERTTAFTASEANRQGSFTTTTAEHQKVFLAAEAERQNTNAATLATQQEQFTIGQVARQADFTTASAENQKQFIEAAAQRQEAYASVVADYTKKLADQNIEFSNQRELAFQSYQTHLATLQGEYEDSAKQILEQVNIHKTEVDKLVGVIGNTGQTVGYLNTANSAQKSKVTWQWITVIALLTLAGGAVYIFTKGAETWEALASRLLTSLPIIILAAYAANQADKYHLAEKRNRKVALELAAIGPYLASLPPEMQNKFRVDIGERSFGHYDDAPPERSPATAFDLMNDMSKSEKAKEWVMSLIKAIRG